MGPPSSPVSQSILVPPQTPRKSKLSKPKSSLVFDDDVFESPSIMENRGEKEKNPAQVVENGGVQHVGAHSGGDHHGGLQYTVQHHQQLGGQHGGPNTCQPHPQLGVQHVVVQNFGDQYCGPDSGGAQGGPLHSGAQNVIVQHAAAQNGLQHGGSHNVGDQYCGPDSGGANGGSLHSGAQHVTVEHGGGHTHPQLGAQHVNVHTFGVQHGGAQNGGDQHCGPHNGGAQTFVVQHGGAHSGVAQGGTTQHGEPEENGAGVSINREGVNPSMVNTFYTLPDQI